MAFVRDLPELAIGACFGAWTVVGRDGVQYRVRCACGNEATRPRFELTSGRSTRCNNHRKADLVGKSYGMLTVLEQHGSDTRGQAMWKCLCSCGNTTLSTTGRLQSGNTQSCGCAKRDALDSSRSARVISLEGTTSGLLTYLSEDVPTKRADGTNRRRIRALCGCGKTATVPAQTYIDGTARSCGCLRALVAENRKVTRAAALAPAGTQYGEWTVLGVDSSTPGKARVNCRCSCGVERSVLLKDLRNGKSTRCGPYHT